MARFAAGFFGGGLRVNAKVSQVLNDMKSLDYCCHRIIELNEELEVISNQKLGLSHNGPRLTREQLNSPLPMPSYQHQYQSPIALMEVATRVESEINYYRRRINECRLIELLDIRDQNILFDLYIFRMNQWDVAEKYGYSRKGLWKHIRTEIGKLLK